MVAEGAVAAGKSTAIKGIKPYLPEWVFTREPGGTEFGELMREAVQERHDINVEPMAALLAYNASRANLVGEVILPTLRSGGGVFLDRYWYSSLAYQGSEGVAGEVIRGISLTATGGLEPGLVLYYDLLPELAIERRGGRLGDLDRYDVKDLDFFAKVREAYLELAGEMSNYWRVIDASQSIEDVLADSLNVLEDFGYLKLE